MSITLQKIYIHKLHFLPWSALYEYESLKKSVVDSAYFSKQNATCVQNISSMGLVFIKRPTRFDFAGSVIRGDVPSSGFCHSSTFFRSSTSIKNCKWMVSFCDCICTSTHPPTHIYVFVSVRIYSLYVLKISLTT